MRHILAIVFVVVFCMTLSSYAQEQITLTTYYPSPHGLYRNLTAAYFEVNSGGIIDMTGYRTAATNRLIDTDHATIYGPEGRSQVVAIRNNDSADRFSIVTDPNNFGGPDTEAFVVTGKGNVGIGANNPSTRFEVYRPAGSVVADYSNPSLGVSIVNRMGGLWARGYNFRDDAGNALVQYGAYGTGTNLNYAYIGTTPSSPWMVVKPNGNVGIGLTNPQKTLDVNGDTRLRGEMVAYGDVRVGGNYLNVTRGDVKAPLNKWGNCITVNSNQGWTQRSVRCPAGYYMTGMDLWCSEDCSDRDEDWVQRVICCQI